MPKAGESLRSGLVGCEFQLIRYLGGSQRSAVFLTERQQGQVAAIKLVPADAATADKQLLRWKLLSKLSHPHILKIFESGRCQQDGEDLIYVVMEYAEENLARTLSTRALALDEVDEMLKPTLQALDYLHNRGFVHGHLKPSNIMVVDNELKLASDGICQIGGTDGADTGTYAPPEPTQTGVAPARDIWSLGVTVVQALTQLLPVHDGGDKQPPTFPETLPPRFAELVHNCLERDPARRCTVREIAEHLQYPSPSPAETVVTPQQVTDRPRKPAPQNRYAKPALAFIVLLAALVGTVKLFNRQSIHQMAPTVTQEQSQPSEPASLTASEQHSQQSPSAEINTTFAPPKAKTRAALKTASEIRNAPAPPSIESHTTPATADFAQGDVIHQVLPDVPRSATNTIRGTVRVTVRVRVDPAGYVSAVNFVSAGPSQYFARLASDAARKWKFSPAHRNGEAVASAWTLRFEFIRGATRVFPVAAP